MFQPDTSELLLCSMFLIEWPASLHFMLDYCIMKWNLKISGIDEVCTKSELVDYGFL